MFKQIVRRILPPLSAIPIVLWIAAGPAPVLAQQPPSQPSIIHKVQPGNDRLEMTVNTSRRLTLDQKIPDMLVNDPSIVEVTPLSPTVIQLSATAPGVTQVNLYGEDGQIYTIDVIVYADARELTMLLQSQFPNAALKVVPVAGSVLISGFVDQSEHVSTILRIAKEYYPTVIDNMTISGVFQVMLRVKVMEISRTKLRTLGFDFSNVITGGDLISSVALGLGGARGGGETIAFSVLDGSNSFFGVLEALREDKLAKILAEPNLVAVSGRSAMFHVGGEFGYTVNGGITGPSVEFKNFGTQVDFVPIVLGNGKIRLEVRAEVSEIDAANSVMGIPALKVRRADTAVELRAGQTLAIGGLVQTRIESTNRGLPWISELPFFGMPFRRVVNQENEVELLILVTPELVHAMDPHEVPACGPGMQTTSPNDWELFVEGHLEVPNCCPPGSPYGGQNPMGYEQIHAPQLGDVGAMRLPPGRLPGPAVMQNRYTPSRPQFSRADSPSSGQNAVPSFIGPIGYDVIK